MRRSAAGLTSCFRVHRRSFPSVAARTRGLKQKVSHRPHPPREFCDGPRAFRASQSGRSCPSRCGGSPRRHPRAAGRPANTGAAVQDASDDAAAAPVAENGCCVRGTQHVRRCWLLHLRVQHPRDLQHLPEGAGEAVGQPRLLDPQHERPRQVVSSPQLTSSTQALSLLRHFKFPAEGFHC